MNVTARILGDPPPDLEERRAAAERRAEDPAERFRVRNKAVLPGRGKAPEKKRKKKA